MKKRRQKSKTDRENVKAKLMMTKRKTMMRWMMIWMMTLIARMMSGKLEARSKQKAGAMMTMTWKIRMMLMKPKERTNKKTEKKCWKRKKRKKMMMKQQVQPTRFPPHPPEKRERPQ